MFKLKKIFVIALFLLALPIAGRAEANQTDLYFFEGQGCPYCAKMKSFLEGLKTDYPNLKVYDFEVYFNKENQALFRKMAEAYGKDTSGVPTIFIDAEVIEGADFEKVKNAVERCSWQTCISPTSKIDGVGNALEPGVVATDRSKNEIVGWVVIGAVAVVGLFLMIFYFRNKK